MAKINKKLRADERATECKASEIASLHFRRCHLCGGVSESSSGRVQACSKCGKVMAPFFFFDELLTRTLSSSEIRTGNYSFPQSTDNSQAPYPPLRGLTAFW